MMNECTRNLSHRIRLLLLAIYFKDGQVREPRRRDMLEKELSTPWLIPFVVFFDLWWSLDKAMY